MSVKIIVDSTADLIPEIAREVSIVPMTVSFGEEEFIDGVTISGEEFYKKLVESDLLPHTSQATPAAYLPFLYDVNKSYDGAVVITLSSTLSGTYQSAVIAASDFENIYVVDSRSVAIGSGILVEYAVRLSKSGATASEIAKKLEEVKSKITIVAMVDTLEYLKKGGRISKTAAIAGGLLNIKPVLGVKDGEISILGKARGSKQGNNLLVSEIEKCGGIDFDMPILLGYSGLSDVLLQKYIEDSRALWETAKSDLNVTLIGSVIGTHVGPGAVAVAFFAKV